jgi:hypothetical protein
LRVDLILSLRKHFQTTDDREFGVEIEIQWTQITALAKLLTERPGESMRYFKSLVFSAITAALLSAGSVAPGQIAVGIGVAPVCPYGYFDYAPYDCAPYGYYGPDWFVGGLFIGAGPWFHGHNGFYGHVDNRYDPRRGYTGPMPDRGTKPFNHFQGNEARDGQGHVGSAPHDASGEHMPGVQGGYHGVAGGSHAASGGGHGGGGHH